MPELPEVETIRIGLSRLLPGHRVLKVKHDWAKGFPNAPSDVKEFLIGAKIIKLERRGKALITEVNTKYSLVIHLKMTGQLVYIPKPEQRAKSREQSTEQRFAAGHPTDSLIGKLPDKSTRVVLQLDKDAQLYFNDQRKFGWIRLIPTAEVPNIDFFKKIGPEPLAADFSAQDFIARLNKRANTSVKAALLDQTVLAGVGNIYADEALWAARIHPATRVFELDERQKKAIFSAVKKVLQLAIDKGGSTDRNYVDAEGKKGSYLSFAKVFRRNGQVCFRHPGTLIEKIKVAGRGTHICPRCQKL